MELKHPSLQLSLALAFWGWQSDMLPFAAVILLLAAMSRHTPWRWEMDIAEFHRVGDLTAVLFGFAIVYFYSTDSDTLPIYAILCWLPVMSAPLLFGQIYSMGQLLPLSALFYSMRRYGIATRVDIRLPYAFLCILAAGSGNAIDQSYYIGVAAFAFWVLWSGRSKRQPALVWLVCFILAVAIGYGAQLGLVRTQDLFEEWAVDWFATWEPDPFKTRTAIGDRGNLKLSSRVILKVSSDPPLSHPLLLKEAVYDRYSGQQWSAGNATFQAYALPHGDGPNHITVLHLLTRHNVLLALPRGLLGLEGPPENDLFHNRLGTVKWMGTPPVVRYRVAYDPNDRDTSAPAPDDIKLSPATREMLAPLAQELGLSRLPPGQAVAAIADLFAARFTYSLDLGKNRNADEALKDFLYHRHTGHCEYFATATALLLRTAAIPARYAVGYSVQEHDSAGKAYLVRQRHAHAWAEAYVDGAWRTLDNTPSRWAEEEAKADPWWQAVADIWSDWAIAFKVWQWERAQRPKEAFPWWAWLVLPLAAWLAWRLYRSRKRVAGIQAKDVEGLGEGQSKDLEYLRLEQRIRSAGHPPRHPGETPLRWLRRLGLNTYADEVLAYYRRRFGGR
ncbi:MAG: transglutaminase-like domain-containing protein [Proteobacteria bacterium]|nr:transglutaminase-like domain-containing protein [Pseudomonadota bacterium]